MLATLALASALVCNAVYLNSCFKDDAGPHWVGVETAAGDPAQMTVDACLLACTSTGFPLFGLTAHTSPSPAAYCYCGSTPAPGAVPAPLAQCSQPCPGNASQACGASYRMLAFNTSCDGPLPKPLANGSACSQPEVQGLPFCNTSLSVTERATDLVARLTPAELGPQLTARNAPAIPRLGLPAFYWGVNNVHGVTNPVSGGVLCLDTTGRCVTIFPSGPGLGASFNESMWRQMGHVAGTEMRALDNQQWGPIARPGVGMDGLTSWGPTINLIRDPRWGRVQETSSECPILNGFFARAVTRGLQEGEDPRFLMVASTLKHFAVYSLEDYRAPNGSHYTRENINSIHLSEWELQDSYYPHFEKAITPVASGGGAAAGVMMAMNEVNDQPCLANTKLIEQLHAWSNTSGLYVSTDGIDMIMSMIAAEPRGHGYCPFHAGLCSRIEGVAAAAMAGSDVCDGDEYDSSLAAAVAAGLVSLETAQARAISAFSIRMRLGLFDPYADQPYTRYGADMVGSDASRASAALAAAESLVLLSNPAPAALPFASTAGTTVIIGFAANSTSALVSNYVSQFCASGGASCYPSLAESVAALGATVVVAEGCSSAVNCPAASIAAAAAAVSAAGVSRVIITLGLDQSLEREQLDRQNLTLPPAQSALFAAVLAAAPAAVPLAVVLVHGGAVAVPELKASRAAILDAFYPGPSGGAAIADALFGVTSPGGKLPYTVYDAAYEGVDFLNFSIAALGRTYRYRTAAAPGGAPLWPFGFGLSYTSFALAFAAPPGAPALTPAAPTFALALTLSNTGARAGDEVVQLYFTPTAGTLTPGETPPFLPVRQLLAFTRVTLAAGAQAPLAFTVDAADVLLVTPAGVRKPISGSYTLTVSRGNGEELTLPFTLAGF